eukprot:6799146-Lingulodinium_polyedra.AAC.1
MQYKLLLGYYVGHHARTASLLVMTREGVQKATGYRRLSGGERWCAPDWAQLRGLPWDVKEA